MKTQTIYYLFSDVLDEGVDYITIATQEQVDDPSEFGLGISDDKLLDILEDHDILEAMENIFENNKDYTQQQFENIFKDTNYNVIEKRDLHDYDE